MKTKAKILLKSGVGKIKKSTRKILGKKEPEKKCSGKIELDIETEAKYIDSLIKASKAGVHITAEQARKLYSLTEVECKTFEQLVDLLINAKKEGVKFSFEKLVELSEKKKNIDKIVEALIKAGKENLKLTGDEIRNIFFSESDRKKIEKSYQKSKESGVLTVHQIKEAFLNNADIEKLVLFAQLLQENDIKMPFGKLLQLLDKNRNIPKCVEIIAESKKNAADELFKLGLFSREEIREMSNVYAVEGKEKFKKTLSDTIIKKQILEDPKKIYETLTQSKGKGFKINLTHIEKYINYDFKPDIDVINKTYIKSRNNDLKIRYDQLVKFAENEIDIEAFIDAQIKSGAEE